MSSTGQHTADPSAVADSQSSDIANQTSNDILATAVQNGIQYSAFIDRLFPPPSREAWLERFRIFATTYPKLAGFFTIQVALTGLPLILFFAFACTTLIVSIVTCACLSLLASMVFTCFAIGIALIFVIPTIILASCSASLLFILSYLGYLILCRFNEGETAAEPGARVESALQWMTGGRFGIGFLTGPRKLNSGKGDHNDVKSHEHVGEGENKHNYHGTPNHEHGNGPLNGKHTSNSRTEWEQKWNGGSHPQSVIVKNSNPYEVLKEEKSVA